MRNLFILLMISGTAALSACSGDDASAPQSAQGQEGSTSLSIDTDEGGLSYEEKSGGNSTSIQIGDNDEKKK